MTDKVRQTIISFFSGAGGLDLGFEQAGYEAVVAYDLFPAAVETYNANREGNVAQVADLSEIDAQTIIGDIEQLGTAGRPVGVIGGPPCQAFSRSNVYPREDDLRRTLPGRYAHLLKGLNDHYQFDFFVFENVQGITFERHTEEFARFRYLFEQAGFRLYEALLNAADYGLPQDRPRVFIVGVRKDLMPEREFSFPLPTTREPVTVGEAFHDAFGNKPWPEPMFFSRSLKPEEIPIHPNHWTMNPRSPKFHNGTLKEGEIKGRSFRVLAWNKPSWTVAYGHREIHVHPTGKRRLSIYEAMILQGFPVDYQLYGTLSDQVKLVSDAVPPPLAQQLAESINAFFDREPVADEQSG